RPPLAGRGGASRAAAGARAGGRCGAARQKRRGRPAHGGGRPPARPPTATRPTLTPLLLAVLALLSAFTPLSIDMYLPALPVIAVDLRGTAGDIQLTLSAFMIAFGVGQIFYCPAGDRFGRRPALLSGLVVYIP